MEEHKNISDYETLYEMLVKEFKPIINDKAFKMGINLPPHLEIKDLVSAGFCGLMDAVEKYKKGNVKFKTYAEIRIHGAMIDMLRENAPTPRSMRLKIKQINMAKDKLRKELGREASEEELAEHLKFSIDELRKIILIGLGGEVKQRIEDINEKNSADDNNSGLLLECLTDDSQATPLEISEMNEVKKILLQAMEEVLNKKERIVIFSYYHGEKTLSEIGKDLNITESRVCQIHGKALEKLKSALAELQNGNNL